MGTGENKYEIIVRRKRRASRYYTTTTMNYDTTDKANHRFKQVGVEWMAE